MASLVVGKAKKYSVFLVHLGCPKEGLVGGGERD